MTLIDPTPTVHALVKLATEHRAEAARLDEIIDTFCTCDDDDADVLHNLTCDCGTRRSALTPAPSTPPDRAAAIRDFAVATGVTIPAVDYVPTLPAWEYGSVAPAGTGPRTAARRRGDRVELVASTTLDDVRWVVPGMSSTVESFQAFSS